MGQNARSQMLSWRVSVVALALACLLWSTAPALGQPVTTDAGLNVAFASTGTGNCSSTQFFDTSTLQCSSCPTGFFASSTRLACVTCATTSGNYFNYSGGFSTALTWSPAVFTSSANTTCACRTLAANQVLAQVNNYGVQEDRCVACPSSATASGTGLTGSCVLANATGALTPMQQLVAVATLLNNQQGAAINTLTYTTASFTVASSTVPGTTVGGTVTNSLPLVTYLGPAAYGCYMGSDRASCNAVANLCVLQLYSASAGACAIYKGLVTYKTAGSGIFNPNAGTLTQAATGPLPWLFYSGTTYSTDGGVDILGVQFKGGSLATGSVSSLTFVLSAYTLNGTWLGFRNFTTQFQLCGAAASQAGQWTQFGWDYLNKCTVTVQGVQAALLESREPIFYDLFLQDGVSSLYPVPIKLVNYDNQVNNADDAGAVRRFYYLDGSLGIDSTNIASGAQYIQYMSTFQMFVTLNQEPKNTILPPAVYLTYTALSPSANADQGQASAFGVTYQNDDALVAKFWKAWQTILIVMEVAVGFPFAAYRVWQYSRNHDSSSQEGGMIVFVVLTFVDVASFMLGIVLLFVTIYYLIIYKLQQAAFFLMVANDDNTNFKTTVILAIVGSSVGLLWCLWEQINVDIYFLDWEKPRKVLNKEGSNETGAPISCWRMMLAANEWNELQSQRVTSPGFTLLLMNFVLVGYKVYSAEDIVPISGDFQWYVNTPTSDILRFGIELSFFLVLFVGQMVFMYVLWYRFVCDPVTQLVDLLFLANISLIILDDKHSGYYVHGQNRAAHSDVSMTMLNEELLKEASGIVAARGLVTDYQGSDKALADNQTFLMYIDDKLRNDYLKERQDEQLNARNTTRQAKGVQAFLAQGSGGPSQKMLDSGRQGVANVFKNMVGEVQLKHSSQVINPTFLQSALRMRPALTPGTTQMVHDRLNGFMSCTMMGVEFRLFMFESLFLCSIDMAIQNFAISAMVTYIIIRFISFWRHRLGETNLTKKTLIDSHFLI